MSQNGGHAAEQDAEVIRPDIGKLAQRQGIFPAARLDREAGAAVVLNETGMLFSTMYFAREGGKQGEKAGQAETWWGNFNGEYVRFYRR